MFSSFTYIYLWFFFFLFFTKCIVAVAIAKPTLTHSWEIDGKELEFVKELGEGTSAKVRACACVSAFKKSE